MLTPASLRTLEEVTRPTVLIIDDEYGPRESIAYTLSSDFEVVTADRASEGFKRLQERMISVILLDIRMPEMDGIRALEEIRRLDKDVSVVMLTGYGTLQTAQQSMLHGANQYLRKPPDIPELILAVKNQAQAAQERRYQTRASHEVELMNAALKQEIAVNEPQIWQARAAVELVHDLVNPLTVMIGYSALLVQESKKIARLSPEHAAKLRNFADVVSRSAEYCHQLADNWKQTTKKTAEYCEVDLVKLVAEVREVIFFNNESITCCGMTEAVIKGSSFELTRVLQNMLKNALESGATMVAVEFVRVGDGLNVSVIDNGSGMDELTAEKALKGGFTTKINGTGLGLGICRHLLGAHGATLTLESEEGRGTTIRMVFPALR